MQRKPSAARIARGFSALLACCVVWFALAPAPVPAQGEDKPSLFLSSDKQQGAVPLEEVILLRPNTDQEVYLWVRNPTADRRYFQVVVTAGDDELARHKFDVQAKSSVRVPLPKLAKAPAEPKSEQKKPEEKKPEPDKPEDKKPDPPVKIDLPEIKTPKLQFRLSETDKDGKVLAAPGKDPLATRTMAVRIMAPREYLQATAYYDAGEGATTVAVKALPNFSGPPCPLTLTFRPDLLPGLRESSTRNGVFKQSVDRSGKEARLVARKIEFQPSPTLTRTGTIAAGADGYERAFLFLADYEVGSGSKAFGLSTNKTAVRVRGAQPDGAGEIRLLSLPVETYPFPVEVDNAPGNARVEVALDRDGDGEFSEAETVQLPGARDEHIYFNPYGRDGGLLFKSTVKDWGPSLDTADVLGEHGVRVRVMMPGLKPGDDPRMVAEVKGKIMFDSTPPEIVKFGEFPKAVVKGQRLPLRVQAKDGESGIVQVNFFLGELKDGKLPEGLSPIKAASPKEGDENYWTAEIPAPDKKGEINIIARATNGVGLVALADTKVELTDPPPATGGIKGKVTEGDNNRLQPNLTVTLKSKAPKDPAKKQQDTWTATTDAKGEFVFDDLPPGEYVASAVKGTGSAKRQGSKTVEVKAKKTVEVEVKVGP